MTEIKKWFTRLEVKPVNTSSEIEGAMQAEIDELRAALKQVEPVAWQYRTRPDWEKDWQQSWMYCSKETFKDYTRAPLIHDWHYEVRELFTHPAREPVLGTKTWMEGGVVMTQNLTASDIYKPVPMTDAQKRDALAAQRGEPWEQSFMLGIKAAEAFHGIKGATS